MPFNTLSPGQNVCHFTDNIFKYILVKENVWISLNISQKFLPIVQIHSIPALVKIMAWCWSGDKPLSEPMMVSLLTHICITRPQWVKSLAWTIMEAHAKQLRNKLSCYLKFTSNWFLRIHLTKKIHYQFWYRLGIDLTRYLSNLQQKEPGHQLSWFWSSFPGLLQFQHKKS